MTDRVCQDVRDKLADEALDDAARTHLASCDACAAFEAALLAVDRALGEMPAHDAPDALVAGVLSAARDERPSGDGPRPERSGKRPPRRARRIVAWALGSGTALSVLFVALGTVVMRAEAPDLQPPLSVASKPKPATIVLDEEAGAARDLDDGIVLAKRGAVAELKDIELPAAARIPATPAEDIPYAMAQPVAGQQRPAFADGTKEKSVDQNEADRRDLEEERQRRLQEAVAMAEQSKNAGKLQTAKKDKLGGRFEQTGEGWTDEGEKRPEPGFLAQLRRTDGLSFVEAEGYWANTYVPGDPAYRLLGARFGGAGIPAAARPYAQPFDAPRSSALAVTMASDHAEIEGRTRLLVQVGLKGTPQHGRRRPAMNVALVLDASGEVSTEDARKLRALVTELAKQKEAGDRMSLFVAGRPGGSDGMLVPPERFEYGAVAVATQQVLGERGGAADAPALSLVEATVRAIEHAAGTGDDTAPLGATAVILITHRALGTRVPALTSLAHESAVAGVPIGAIGVGNAALPELDRIALAGQGNRRLLDDAAGAEALVARELASVSRVVARAVRLRIRLAPGVKLVDVIGSRRLDTLEATQVKQAEKSIDLRLSKDLGIDADRGEDEDGIQIVIPSYYAGDEHVILLDVVAPNPGPVADVQVRYKDLVYLKNGVARARLAVLRGRRAPGPLQLAVLKNLVSHRVSEYLSAASQNVALGNSAGAKRLLELGDALIAEIHQEVPALSEDPDLARDRSMLAAYRVAVDRGAPDLAPSLRFAAKAKILPPLPSSSH